EGGVTVQSDMVVDGTVTAAGLDANGSIAINGTTVVNSSGVLTSGVPRFEVNRWYASSDNKPRVGYIENSATLFRSGHSNSPLFEFRNAADQWQIKIDNKGRIKRYYYDYGYQVGAQNEGHGGSDLYTNPIYTIGTQHLPTHTSLGDMYGIGYSHGNFWGTTDARPGGWGQYVAADGDIRIILEASAGTIWAASDVRAPIYYDKNDTGYYLDPNGRSKLSALETHGRHYAKNGVHVQGDWVRVDGINGIYFQSYGGGWHMQDTSYLRAFGGKHIYTSGQIQTHKYAVDGAGNTAYITRQSNGIVFCDANAGHGNRCAVWDGDGNWDAWSDERLKTNIKEETYLLDKIMKVPVKSFDWKEAGSNKNRQIGFIAQDVEPYFPHLVSELNQPSTNISYKTLAHSDFGILAFGGVRELKQEKDQEITGLKAENQALKSTINELIQRIEILESKLN
ncbi:MAG: tail fiber domain-containing protein, partial [Candidatus Margulisiibacteriota bacterium]